MSTDDFFSGEDEELFDVENEQWADEKEPLFPNRPTRKPTQVELYGPLLTLEQQIRKEIASFPELTREQEDVLLERVRVGDTQAKNDLMQGAVLPYLAYWASQLFFTYSWVSPRIEYADLLQVGSIFAWTHFEVALKKDAPLAYLKVCARYQMRLHCLFLAPFLIVTPRSRDREGRYAEAYQEPSLDRPVGEGELFLSDVLAAPDDPSSFASSEEASIQLYEALEQLPDYQRSIVGQVFGLVGYGRERIVDLAMTRGVSESSIERVRDRAIKKLRVLLSPELCTTAQASQRLGIGQKWFVAFATKRGVKQCAQGRYRKQDIEALAQQLVDEKALAARRAVHREEERRERLQMAYQRLTVQSEKVTVRQLAREAHVAPLVAADYLMSYRQESQASYAS
jgi:DNA-directed RNA polymerase specialized sigma24 family protein